MALKQTETLSRADFDQAVVFLRANVSEIAKATGIPRTYLSEFRNGDRKLRPEHQAKLRDYFEGKGVEFDDDGNGGEPEDKPARQGSSPHPKLRALEAVRCYFPVSDAVPESVAQRTLELMDEDEVRLAVLLKQLAARNNGFFGDGEWTEETRASLQEAGSLLAEIAVFFLMLRGWRALGVKPAGEGPDSLRDVLIATYRPRLEVAGLIEPDDKPKAKAKEADPLEEPAPEVEQADASKPPAFPWMRQKEEA